MPNFKWHVTNKALELEALDMASQGPNLAHLCDALDSILGTTMIIAPSMIVFNIHHSNPMATTCNRRTDAISPS